MSTGHNFVKCYILHRVYGTLILILAVSRKTPEYPISCHKQHYVIDGFKHFFTAKKIPSLFLKLNMIAILGTFSVVTLVNPSNTLVFRVLPENLQAAHGIPGLYVYCWSLRKYLFRACPLPKGLCKWALHIINWFLHIYCQWTYSILIIWMGPFISKLVSG